MWDFSRNLSLRDETCDLLQEPQLLGQREHSGRRSVAPAEDLPQGPVYCGVYCSSPLSDELMLY